MLFSIYGARSFCKLRLVDEPGDGARTGEVSFAAHHVPEDSITADSCTSILGDLCL